MINRSLKGKVSEDVFRTLEDMDRRLTQLTSALANVKPGNGNGEIPLTPLQLQQVAGLIGGRSQAVIGIDVADPQLPGQVGATGTVGSVGANNSVAGLTMTISSPTTSPVINLSGTPNIGGGNVVSGTINKARLPASGWTAWTGTATRTSFDTATATLPNVAEAVKALIDDLAHA